jgi:glycosyltransferase involved in cell wall biosynthesis
MASGDLRFSKMLQILVQFAAVDFLIPQFRPRLRDPERRYWESLESVGIRFVNPVFYRQRLLWLNATRYDWVLAEFWHEAERFMPDLEVIRSNQPQLRFAVDTVDVHFLRELAALQFDSNRTEEQRQQVLYRKSRELAVYRAADLVMVVTEEDRLALNEELVATNMVIISNIVSIQQRLPGSRDDKILFVGGFCHRPNVDAIHWFADEVFPVIRQHCPTAEVHVVGSHPPEDVRLLELRQGINVVGYVESTTPYLQSAAVSVAPLRFGAGMKGKVTEALSAGVPVVTTTVGAQGLAVRSGEHLWIADDSQSFANAVIFCLKDKIAAEKVATNGQALVQSLCARQFVQHRLQQALADPLEQRQYVSFAFGLRRLRARIKCFLVVIRSGIRNFRERLRLSMN